MSKVSVVVPVYNAQEYLRRCVDSILNQTYTDLEIILVDDGSTDQSAEICKEYAVKDSRVRYLFQENAGPDYARKKGVQVSTGEYLTFADADDYVDADMIGRLHQELVERNCDMVCSQAKRVDDSGRIWDVMQVPKDGILCENVQDSMTQFFVTRYISGSYYAKLYRRELLQDYEFVKDSLIGEDITAVLYALEKAARVFVMADAFYYYYWNENSISHSGYTDRHYVSLQNYIKLRDELVAKQYIQPCYVAGFFAEYEMAVATAMSRNWKRDAQAMRVLRSDLHKNRKVIMSNPLTPLYMKVCIWMFRVMPHVFMGLYRILYLVTGR